MSDADIQFQLEPLFHAIRFRDLDMVKDIVESKNFVMHSSVFDKACVWGALDIVKYLLPHVVDYKDKRLGLRRSASLGRLDLFKFLLKITSQDDLSLDLETAAFNDRENIVEFILSTGIKCNPTDKPLFMAVNYNLPKIVDMLLENIDYIANNASLNRAVVLDNRHFIDLLFDMCDVDETERYIQDETERHLQNNSKTFFCGVNYFRSKIDARNTKLLLEQSIAPKTSFNKKSII